MEFTPKGIYTAIVTPFTEAIFKYFFWLSWRG